MTHRICGPGLCRCDETDQCPECAVRPVVPGCDGLCEECWNDKGEPEEQPDDALVHDTWEEHRGER
jgi:hypothetical protein